MALKIEGSAGVIDEVDATHKARRVTLRPPQGDGYYSYAGLSGLLTGAAAASVVWAFRWTHATKVAVIEHMRVRSTPTTPFTAAQAWGFDAVIGRSFTGTHTGGTATTPAATTWKERASFPTSNVAEIRMATTAAFTGGTVTADAAPFMLDFAWELVAGATVPRSRVFFEKDYTNGGDSPLVLAANEGILVRPTHAMGAGGVVQLGVELAWREVDATAFP